METSKRIESLRATVAELKVKEELLIDELRAEFKEDVHNIYVSLVNKIYDIGREIDALKRIPEVGKFANEIRYSDINPFEIIKVISDTTLEIRSMSYEIDFVPEFVTGGFAGHCTNNDKQNWKIESNENGHVMRIRKNKHGQWKYKGTTFSISDQPRKFYDYNF